MFDTLKKGKTEHVQAKAKADAPHPSTPSAIVHSGVLSDSQTSNNCKDGNTEILSRPNTRQLRINTC